MKLSKAFYFGLLSICAVMLVVSGCNKQTASEPKSPNKAAAQQPQQPNANAAPLPEIPEIIAEVNGEKLTRKMAEAEIEQMLSGVKPPIPQERIPEIKFRMIDRMIENFVVKTLLMSEAKKANLTATPEEIDKRLTEIKASIPAGMSFETIVKEKGLTEAKVREDIGLDVMINKLFIPVTNGITVTEAETTEYIEKNKESLAFPESVRASHILVGVAKTDDEKMKAEKKAKIVKIKEQLDKGSDFAALAKENSDCPSKEMGGDLGEFRKGQMAKPFEDAAFSQATNTVGAIVETEFGYHVIKVTDHKQAGQPPKEEITKALMRQKFDDARRKYVGDLAKKATIKNNMPQRMMEPPMGMGMGMPEQAPEQSAPEAPASPAPAPAAAPDAPAPQK